MLAMAYPRFPAYEGNYFLKHKSQWTNDGSTVGFYMKQERGMLLERNHKISAISLSSPVRKIFFCFFKLPLFGCNLLSFKPVLLRMSDQHSYIICPHRIGSVVVQIATRHKVGHSYSTNAVADNSF